MKYLLISLLSVIYLTMDNDILPNVLIKKLDGSKISTNEIIKNDGKPVVISFWATWCKPCKKELDAMAENYDDWKKRNWSKNHRYFY